MKNKWSLCITRTDNGYYLTGSDEIQTVLQETEDSLSVHEQLLWEVMDYFDFRGSKHDPERIRITREKGESSVESNSREEADDVPIELE